MSPMVTVTRPFASRLGAFGALVFLSASFLLPALAPQKFGSEFVPLIGYVLAACSLLLGRSTSTTRGELVVQEESLQIGTLEIRRRTVSPGWMMRSGDGVALVLPLRGWYHFGAALVIAASMGEAEQLRALANHTDGELRLRQMANVSSLSFGFALGCALTVAAAFSGAPNWLRVHAFILPLLLPALTPGWIAVGGEQLTIREWYGGRKTVPYERIAAIVPVVEQGAEHVLLKLVPDGTCDIAVSRTTAHALAEWLEERCGRSARKS
jgi:hypothetical protein